jgi:hypothetical protein
MGITQRIALIIGATCIWQATPLLAQTPTPTPAATPTPTPTSCLTENFDGVAAPALPAGGDK